MRWLNMRTAHEIIGGAICILAIGVMVAENPWSVLLIVICAVLT